MRKEFTRKIIFPIEYEITDRPRPYWASHTHMPKRVRAILTLDCGHKVSRRACSITKTTKSAVCEWCQEMKEQIA